MANVTIHGVTMTSEAARVVAETGTDVAADLASLRSGATTIRALLAECLDGADADRVDAWHEYVESLSLALKEVS